MEQSEADKILELFTLRVQQGVQQINKTVQDAADKQRSESSLAMQQLELRIASQVIQVREEQRREFSEVKADIKEIQTTQNAQAVDVAEIKTRLNEGEKRFDQHEERLEEVEAELKKTGKGVAALIGVGGASGGLGAAIMHFLK